CCAVCSHDTYLDGMCGVCGAACGHDTYVDGKCEECGAVCSHDTYIDGKCGTCGAVCSHDTYIDGKCGVCGAACGHGTYTDGKCDTCGAVCGHETYVDGKCEDCGAVCTHDAYENGFCTVCDVYQSAELKNGYYEIGNAGQLYWFADKVNNDSSNFASAKAKLTANITVNTNVLNSNGEPNGDGGNFRAWAPIGTESGKYAGTFDGCGFTISGLYYNNYSSAGLFRVTNGSTIANVTLADSYLYCYNNGQVVGGIVGTAENTTITNCHNAGTVGGSSALYVSVGGIAARTDENCVITDCSNRGLIKGHTVGGIVSDNDGVIENCYNTGVTRYSAWSGGITSSNTGKIRNCYNTEKEIYADWNYGGITGTNNDGINNGILENCYSIHDSIVGYTADVGTVTNCYYQNGEADNVSVAKSAEAFASGEIAYKLGNAWGQTLGEDAYPVLGGAKVYPAAPCIGYTNDASGVKNHTIVNGKCDVCGALDPALAVVKLVTTGGTTAHYLDLSSAIKDAQFGDSIYLLKDVVVAEVLNLKAMNLYLCGHTITLEGAGKLSSIKMLDGSDGTDSWTGTNGSIIGSREGTLISTPTNLKDITITNSHAEGIAINADMAGSYTYLHDGVVLNGTYADIHFTSPRSHYILKVPYTGEPIKVMADSNMTMAWMEDSTQTIDPTWFEVVDDTHVLYQTADRSHELQLKINIAKALTAELSAAEIKTGEAAPVLNVNGTLPGNTNYVVKYYRDGVETTDLNTALGTVTVKITPDSYSTYAGEIVLTYTVIPFCEHTELRYVDNGDNTHAVYCAASDCGQLMEAKVPHTEADGNGICDDCGCALYASLTADGVTTGYTSIKAAWNAAPATGGRITVLRDDTAISNVIELSGSKKVVIDLNGKKLATANAYYIFVLANGADVTFTGSGTVRNTREDSTAVHIYAGTKATIEGGTWSGTNYALDVLGTAVVTGGILDAENARYAAIVEGGGSMTIRNAKVSYSRNGIRLNGGKLTIGEDVVFECHTKGVFPNDVIYYSGSLDLTGFTGDIFHVDYVNKGTDVSSPSAGYNWYPENGYDVITELSGTLLLCKMVDINFHTDDRTVTLKAPFGRNFKVPLSSIPTPEGKRLFGWAAEPGGEAVSWADEIYGVQPGMDLYAVWIDSGDVYLNGVALNVGQYLYTDANAAVDTAPANDDLGYAHLTEVDGKLTLTLHEYSLSGEGFAFTWSPALIHSENPLILVLEGENTLEITSERSTILEGSTITVTGDGRLHLASNMPGTTGIYADALEICGGWLKIRMTESDSMAIFAPDGFNMSGGVLTYKNTDEEGNDVYGIYAGEIELGNGMTIRTPEIVDSPEFDLSDANEIIITGETIPVYWDTNGDKKMDTITRVPYGSAINSVEIPEAKPEEDADAPFGSYLIGWAVTDKDQVYHSYFIGEPIDYVVTVPCMVYSKIAPVEIIVGGVQVTPDNLVIDSSDLVYNEEDYEEDEDDEEEIIRPQISGKATYDPETNTLTLDNFVCYMEGHEDQGYITYLGPEAFTIVLVGDSDLMCVDNDPDTYVIRSDSDTTIKGSGTLIGKSGAAGIAQEVGSLIFESGTIHIETPTAAAMGPAIELRGCMQITDPAGAYIATVSEKGMSMSYIAKANGAPASSVTIEAVHTMQLTADKIEATCEQEGREAIYTCTCGKTTGGEPIEAIGHDMQQTSAKVEATCENNGKEAIYTCAN
ncbi:MAG: hypothetical protein IKU27_02865, partial [Clostridia bacterium]|nr:hypothetical protein [Clostridia bacterium]